jgi:predicted PurR-regulated permease PerM
MNGSVKISKNNSTNSSVLGIYRLLIVFFFIITIYFAQTIIIPLTIAFLLTFLLSPLVINIERWLGRITSIFLVVIIVFSMIGFIGYVFTRQLILFGTNFKNYYEIIQSKLQALHFPKGGIFSRIEHLIVSLKEELFGNSVNTESDVSSIEMKLIDLSSHAINFAESFFGSFFNVLGMAVIILVLVVFMLFNREDILGRIIKLMGQNRISSTTSAMNEAGERVFRYLFRLFIVNVVFGFCVAIALFLIGIPNAVLWGGLAAILRFIPYIGIWIAAIIPIILSFVVTDSWYSPVLTISFFIIIEIITSNIIEPLYYGVGTGVSSFALIMAAIFWTWFWGPVGLLLSTPLTVCLVVLGQYMPNMSFLRILLSQEKALTPTEELYHRLLSSNASESIDVIESYMQNNSLISAYDSILIPIIAQTEKDFQQELIDIDQKEEVYQNVNEVIEFLGISEQKERSLTITPKGNVFCLPAHAKRDEIGVSILTQLFIFELYDVSYTTKLNVDKLFELIEEVKPEAFFIVAIAPFYYSKTRFLCAKIHQRKPELPIIVCLLGGSEAVSQDLDKLKISGATKIVLSLSEAIQSLPKHIL